MLRSQRTTLANWEYAQELVARAVPDARRCRFKYRGAVPAVLEDRPGLTAAVLRTFVRQGSWSMPPFRPTELTDAEIGDIAAYLAVTSAAAARSQR